MELKWNILNILKLQPRLLNQSQKVAWSLKVSWGFLIDIFSALRIYKREKLKRNYTQSDDDSFQIF